MARCWPKGIQVVGLFFALAAAAILASVALLFPRRNNGARQPRLLLRVAGRSMADALVGRHYEVRCADCGFRFFCGVEEPPRDGMAVCPNCGYAQNRLRAQRMQPGDRVTVDRSAYGTCRPGRWQIAAFHTPGDEAQWSVKRIVGLPGERVAIRGGDLFINGLIERKTLPQLRAMAILVHDNHFRPSLRNDLPARWRPESAASRWRPRQGGFVLERSVEDGSPPGGSPRLDWLVYHHWPCLPSLAPRATEAPIQDNYAYNQGLSRKLHLVTDVMLSCRVVLRDWEQLALRIHDGYDHYVAQLSHQRGRIVLRRGAAEVAKARLAAALPTGPLHLEIAVCDRRLMLAIEGQVVIQHDLRTGGWPLRPSCHPLAIGAAGRSIRVWNLRVWRDLYYLDPAGIGRAWSLARPLGDQQFFVLGDNVPVSVDSRSWARAGLPRKLLLGKVLGSARRPL